MIITFCTECAEEYTQIDKTHYVCQQGHDFWNNPKAAAAVVLYNEKGELLYSKRGREPAKGLYDFPGGFCEFNEDPFEAAKREILEETSMIISDLELVGAYSGLYGDNESVCDFVFIAHKFQGEPVADDDAEALEWKPIDFINDPTFNPDYPGLVEKLKTVVARPK